MIIGITGSSGAGKSTICEILQIKYNVTVINADKLTKKLAKKGTEYLNDIVKEFGEQILLEDGELNRPKLADIIYSDEEKREILNTYTFKYIQKEIQMKIKEKANTNEVIVIDAPLLFEAELQKYCDFIIAVISDDRELQIDRIVQRDGITKRQAIARLNAQKANEFYISKSKYIIVNNGELEEVEKQIDNIIKKEIYEKGA